MSRKIDLYKKALSLIDPYSLLAYEKNEAIAFAKILAFYIVYWYENTLSPQIIEKYKEWREEADPLIKEINVTPEISAIEKMIAKSPRSLPGDKVEAFQALLLALRAKIYVRNQKNLLMNRSSMPPAIKTLLTYAFSAIIGKSQSAMPSFEKNIGILNEPTISNYFVPILNLDPKKIKLLVTNYLNELKNFTGKNIIFLNLIQLKNLNKAPIAVKDHILGMEKTLVALIKNIIVKLARESSDGFATSAKINAELKSLGIPNFYVPDGFVGKYDDKLNMYLMDGDQLSGNQIGGTMKMMPKGAKVNYVAKGKGARVAEEITYRRKAQSNQNSVKKFNAVRDFIPQMPLYVAKWRKQLIEGSGDTKKLAAMAETLFYTAGRIGSISAASRTDKPTYGISSLRAKNVVPFGNGIRINYIGKKQVDTTHDIMPLGTYQKELINYLLKLKSKKKPNDFLFTVGNTNDPIGEKSLSNFLKNDVQLPEGITPHKFRHARGSDLLMQIIQNNPKELATASKSANGLTNFIKEAAVEVGKKLGHMRMKDNQQEPIWSTAIKSYIDPTIIKDLYTKYDFAIPSSFASAMKESSAEE
jgi:hypothetical protein